MVGKKELFLVEGKSGNHPKDKSINYNGDHGENEPRESLKIIFDHKLGKIFKTFQIDFFTE